MRKIAVAALAAATALLVASPSAAEPPAAITRTLGKTPTAPTMTQGTYLSTVRALLAGQPGDAQSDQTLIEGGKSLCSDIDAGATADTFEEQIDSYNLNRAIYRVVIRSSILTFCPQHSSVIR